VLLLLLLLLLLVLTAMLYYYWKQLCFGYDALCSGVWQICYEFDRMYQKVDSLSTLQIKQQV